MRATVRVSRRLDASAPSVSKLALLERGVLGPDSDMVRVLSLVEIKVQNTPCVLLLILRNIALGDNEGD